MYCCPIWVHIVYRYVELSSKGTYCLKMGGVVQPVSREAQRCRCVTSTCLQSLGQLIGSQNRTLRAKKCKMGRKEAEFLLGKELG